MSYRLKYRLLGLVVLFGLQAGCKDMAATHQVDPVTPGVQTPQPAQGVPARHVGSIVKLSDLPDDMGKYCPDELQFVTEKVGWLSCNDRIWRTTDGGVSWAGMAVSDVAIHASASFFFIGPEVGWCQTHTAIQRTDDGGRTWKRVPDPIHADDGYDRRIDCVAFLRDGETGWLSASKFEPIPPGGAPVGLENARTDGPRARRGMIYGTTNGGRTWHQQSAPIPLGSLVSGFYISQSNQVWGGCDSSLLHLVGQKWEKVDFAASNCTNAQLLAALTGDVNGDIWGITGIEFADAANGWLSIGNGILVRTRDGGRTWCDLLAPYALREEPNEAADLSALHFADSKNGWVLTFSGKLYRTHDGGASWEKIQSDARFNQMFFLNAQNGWLVAKKGESKGVFKVVPD